MEYDLIGFNPDFHTGTGFAGWFNPAKKKAVFVKRMYHYTSVMNDGDFYDAKPTDKGERYGFMRSEVADLDPCAVSHAGLGRLSPHAERRLRALSGG